MTLVEVTYKKTVADFHKLPFLIYKDDKNWIPHLKQDVEKVFDRSKNKKWRKGKAIRWVAYSDSGQIIGRIAAFEDGSNKEYRSGLGFFECINDQTVAFALFDKAKAWLEEQGMERMDGPINFGENHQFWGLITENFNEPPYYGQNYNPEYYVPFFENYGFQVYYKQLIFFRDITRKLEDKFTIRARRLMEDPNYTVRHVDIKQLEKFTEDFRTIYNRAWANREKGFTAMSSVQAKAIMTSLKPIMDPELMYFAYHKDQPIGMYIQLPEINQIFKHVNGNLNLWGKLKFLYHKKRRTARRCFGMVFGVDPKFQGKGVEGMLFKYMESIVHRDYHYKDLVITWIGDFNPKMIAIVENLGATKLREMATYRYLFDREAEFKRKPIANIKPSGELEKLENNSE